MDKGWMDVVAMKEKLRKNECLIKMSQNVMKSGV